MKKIGGYDNILARRQAADWDFGQVGALIAEILNIPTSYIARSAKLEYGNVVVEKLKRFGYEVVKAPMPVLITASSEIGDLRLPSLNAIKDARGNQ